MGLIGTVQGKRKLTVEVLDYKFVAQTPDRVEPSNCFTVLFLSCTQLVSKNHFSSTLTIRLILVIKRIGQKETLKKSIR